MVFDITMYLKLFFLYFSSRKKLIIFIILEPMTVFLQFEYEIDEALICIREINFPQKRKKK